MLARDGGPGAERHGDEQDFAIGDGFRSGAGARSGHAPGLVLRQGRVAV